MAKFSGTWRRPLRPNLTAPVRTTGARALTHEGGEAFLRDPESELFLLAATNMVGEDTFYERAGERDRRFVELIHRVTDANPAFIAGADPDAGRVGLGAGRRVAFLSGGGDGLHLIGKHVGVKEIPPLPPSTILLVEVGSTAHGTGLPGGEDHDEMGVVVEAPADVVGLGERGFATVMQRTQPEGARSGPGDVDRTLHSLRRFLRLAAGGNPSILMSFWAPVLHATDAGHELRALGEAFVGRHVVPRYRGYMQSQAERLLRVRGGGHGRRGGGQREELVAAHGYDTKYAMHCARLGFQCIELLTIRQLQLPIQGEPAEWLRAVRRGEVPFDEWERRWHDLDAQLEQLAGDEVFPAGADRERIEAWSVATHLAAWATGPASSVPDLAP